MLDKNESGHMEIREKVLTVDGAATEMGSWQWEGYVQSLGSRHSRNDSALRWGQRQVNNSTYRNNKSSS